MKPCTGVLLTFGDSSGNPSRSEKAIADTPHYIIVTITMDAGEARRVGVLIQELKIRHFGEDNLERAEFHAHALKNLLFWLVKDMTLVNEGINAIFDDIVGIVLDMDAIINVVIMDKRPANSASSPANTVEKSWNGASSMLCRALMRSFDPVNMILLDRYDDATNRTVNRTVVQALRPLVNAGNPEEEAAIPRPMFVGSRSCNLVQLADVIAYIVARVSKKNDAGPFARWCALLEPKISHMAYGTVDR